MRKPFSRLLIAIASLLALSACAQVVPSSTESSQTSTSSISSSSDSSSSSVSSDSSSQTTSSSSASTSSSDSEEGVHPCWEGLDYSLYGSSFRNALARKIEDSYGGALTSYSGLFSVFAYSDVGVNGTGIRPFYHGDPESGSRSSMNREHVWPDSRGGNLMETDPQMVRPTYNADNSSRGNHFFGNEYTDEWDPASFGYAPARGEAARIIFYCATRYAKQNVYLTNNPKDDWNKVKTMGTLKTLLEWNRTYAVTAAEIRRNESLYDHGFARNPFIDDPSFADYIWDSNGLRTSAFEGSSSSNSSCSATSVSSSSSASTSTSRPSSTAVYTDPCEIVFADQGWGNATAPTRVTTSEISVSFTSGNNPTLYYENGEAVRIYSGGSFTITAVNGHMLDNVVLSFATDSVPEDGDNDVGIYDADNRYWEGPAESVTFTRPSSPSSGHWRLSAVYAELAY